MMIEVKVVGKEREKKERNDQNGRVTGEREREKKGKVPYRKSTKRSPSYG